METRLMIDRLLGIAKRDEMPLHPADRALLRLAAKRLGGEIGDPIAEHQFIRIRPGFGYWTVPGGRLYETEMPGTEDVASAVALAFVPDA